MSTASSIRRFRTAQNDIVKLAEREIQQFYNNLDVSNPVKTARLLEAFMPELIQSYGGIGAAVAADFYEELREASPAAKPAYRTVLSDAIPLEQVTGSTKWAVQPLFRETAEPLVVLSNLHDISDRLIKQAGRNTIDTNAHRDPAQVRYARVPTGSETCKFCLMLASRGAVYLDSKSAGEVNKYHGKCDCVPSPVWSQRDLDTLRGETGYNPDELYQAYLDTA